MCDRDVYQWPMSHAGLAMHFNSAQSLPPSSSSQPVAL
eukprot:COSAG01_NODE_3531_length_5963_cov_101.190655_7_plen_38_part_00